MDNVLIIFLKHPVPGKVKTRLAKDIGDEKACTIYKQLANGVIKNIFSKSPKLFDVHIFFTPPDKLYEIKDWLKPLFDSKRGIGIHYVAQEGAHLGERMSNAFKQTFQGKSCKRCIIIGTDCPEIDAALIDNAFKILNRKDVVIGPCKDGGYYLLGMSRLVPDLFTDIDWSTDRVFDQTVEKIEKNNLSRGVLKVLTDIDTQKDLHYYESVVL